MQNETSRYYSENSKAYFDDTKNIVISEQIDRFLSAVGNRDELILDLGCGSGNSLKYIIEKKYTAMGADISDELMALAREHTGAWISRLDIEDVAAVNGLIEEKKAVHLFASASLLHIKKRALARFFNEIEFSGCFFFSVKEGEGESFDPAGRFFAYYSKEELDGMLAGRFETLHFDRNADSMGRGNNWLSYIVRLRSSGPVKNTENVIERRLRP